MIAAILTPPIRLIATLCLILGATLPTASTGQDLAAGEKLYQSVCRNCHGPTAKGMASFPKLADKSVDHLVTRLQQYRAGETVGPNSPLMMPLATDLSDDEIADLAAYITTAFQ